MFVNIAVNISSGQSVFTYAVPHDMQHAVAVGKRVLVPFGKRRVTGYIIEITGETERSDLKEIIDVLDLAPLFDERTLIFYRWLSDYYMHPLGKCLKTILPGGLDIENSLWIKAGDPLSKAADPPLSDVQREIAAAATPGGISLASLKKRIPKHHIHKDVALLERRGFLHIEDRLTRPDVRVKRESFVTTAGEGKTGTALTEKQRAVLSVIADHDGMSLSGLRASLGDVSDTVSRLARRGLLTITEREVFRSPDIHPGSGAPHQPVTLTDEQQKALDAIRHGITSRTFSPFLLHGVTGSGKTEVYLKAIEEILRGDGCVIYLVPEIALTPQLLARVAARFDRHLLAVIHSGVGRGVKYDEWRRIQKGDARIIVGARSAIFAPAVNLRLIIVDEEHDTSYKQEDRLAYNARDLALVRGAQSGAVVVLGSATPGIQTYRLATTGQYRYLPLTRRVEDRPLPDIEIIDMKEALSAGKRVSAFSERLLTALKDTLAAGKQSLLFLNRRGFNTFLYCDDCGNIFRCLNCAVAMKHHRAEGVLKCHYCDYSVKVPPRCVSCGGTRTRYYGTGTERIQEEIQSLFPVARVARMDSDSTARRGSHERILLALEKGDIDILIGTQMITKGHDYPNVTLVGVISADTSLNIPDFRAAERTFQIITQVSGRGGRGDHPGTVVIQTVNPQHYALVRARAHDYRGFYEDEIALRQELCYPPFSRMICVRISGTSKTKVEHAAERVGEIARECCRREPAPCRVEPLGPSEAPIPKMKGRYRWHMLLRGADVPSLHAVARAVISHAPHAGVDIKIDVDPVNFI